MPFVPTFKYRSLLFASLVMLMFSIGWMFHDLSFSPPRAEAQWLDDQAPEFFLYSSSGEEYSNYSLQGAPALLMFWAPWCGVCQRELPKLAEVYHEGTLDGIQVLALGGSDTQAHVEDYIDNHPDTFVFPTAYDQYGEAQKGFQIKAFPTYVLLDENGMVQLVHRGAGLLRSSSFTRWLAQWNPG